MILGIFLSILGTSLFISIGFLLSNILFPKAELIERSAFTLALSIGFLGVLANVLYTLGIYNKINFIVLLIFFLLLFLIILKKKNHQSFETPYNKSILFLIGFSIFGTMWRYLSAKYFQLHSFSNSDTYGYSFKFIGEKVPDLGFYTGMAQDKSTYVGNIIQGDILNYLHIHSVIVLFLAVFFYVSFIYLLFKEFRKDEKLAYLGVAIMSVGPIELFYASNSIYEHSLSYIIVLPFFLLFISNKKNILWVVALLSLTMMNTYYTSAVIIILLSIGFCLALMLKELTIKRSIKDNLFAIIKNKKIVFFISILCIVGSYTLLFSGMSKYSIGRIQDNSDSKQALQTIIHTNDNLNTDNTVLNTSYKDPTFIYLSAIRWQMLFFFLCGLTFIFYVSKNLLKNKKVSEEHIYLLLCLIPVLLVSYGFWHVNLPTRIFDYFAFFGLLVITIPKKYYKIFFILSFCFIIITNIFIAKDKKVFFVISEGEYYGAKEISSKIEGKVFSDQVFANQLIFNNYYNVTGADDKDPIVTNLFYQNNPTIFKDSIQSLYENGIDYIATTKRMRGKYILMLNSPKIQILNSELFKNLKIMYDNGDVVLYSTKEYNEQ